MANPHLGEVLPVPGALDAVIVLPAAEPIPHGFDIRRNGGGGPVRVSVVGDHAAQVLKLAVFVLY